ncbi:prenyltransferase/squalene oxidase repeat-containing protein [Paenibacillus sp. BAC0078]
MLGRISAINDEWTNESLQRQITDRSNRYFGGVRDPLNGVAWPSHTGTAQFIAVWAASLVNPASQYHHDIALLEKLQEGMDFMLRFQHEDGTISPGWTNYHSPPDTAFVVVGFANVLTLLEQQTWEPLAAVTQQIRLFLQRTVPAMLTGGVHTPNHRWVLAAALGSLYRIFALDGLKQRADEWLQEGMDITPDGEWTERSNGIYNTVSDIMLYYASQDLERPELLEPVRRNLRMMKYLVHPDGEVVTDYSGRQDFGSVFSLADYYLCYKLMAEHDRDPEFAALAELAGSAVTHPGSLPNNIMLGFLLYPQMQAATVQPEALPVHYRKVINGAFNRQELLNKIGKDGYGGPVRHSKQHTEFGAPVARIRNGATSATVMTEASSHFSLRHGKARLLGVQLASSFEPGLITMQSLEETDSGFLLSSTAEKGYYGPVPGDKLPSLSGLPASPWYLLPHGERPLTHSQPSKVTVRVTDHSEGWDLHFAQQAPSDVLTQIVLLFGKEGSLEGTGIVPVPEMRDTSFWTSGTIRYTAGEDWMELDQGAHEHELAEVRGMTYPDGCLKVIVSLITPLDYTMRIRLS